MSALREAAGRRWDAIVVGGGIAGLSAAWEFSRAGLRPLVLEARGYPGGQIAAMPVGGAMIDIGAESFAPRGTAVSSMLEELGLEVEEPGGGRPFLFLPPLPTPAPASAIGGARGDGRGLSGASRGATNGSTAPAEWVLRPFAERALMGVPADPGLPGVRAILGDEGVARALLDRSLDPSLGADAPDLASFVEARMGRAVLERLVRPIVAGIHSTDPSLLAVDRVVPGLREGLAARGSLAGAVEAMLAASSGRRGDVGIRGGMRALVAALVRSVEEAGGLVLTRVGARSLARSRSSEALPPDSRDGAAHPATGARWALEAAPTTPAPTPSKEPVPAGPVVRLEADRVVLASSPPAARRLLAPFVGGVADLALPQGAPIVRCFLAVRAPGLDRAPVGPGLLVAPDEGAPVRAKALSQLDLKWSGVAEALRAAHGPHAHLLRLSYGRPGEEERAPSLDEILHDAAILTGVPLSEEDVLDHRVVHWNGTLAQPGPSLRARIDEARAAVDALGRIGLTGAWAAGSGVSRVVEDARTRARALLPL